MTVYEECTLYYDICLWHNKNQLKVISKKVDLQKLQKKEEYKYTVTGKIITENKLLTTFMNTLYYSLCGSNPKYII